MLLPPRLREEVPAPLRQADLELRFSHAAAREEPPALTIGRIHTMNSTNNNAPQSTTASSAHAFKRRAAVVAIVLVAAMIPCMVIRDGMSRRAHGKTDTGPAPVAEMWGRLEYTPIVISPPLEFVPDPTIKYYSRGAEWHFPQTNTTELSMLFKSINLSEPFRKKLISMTAPNKTTGGMSIYPPREFVLNVSPKDRSALYIALREDQRNVNQQALFPFRGNSPDEWFAGSGVSPATRKLVEPLIYRRGEFMYFADLPSIGYLPARTERSNLLKTLMRDATFLAHLKISPDSDIEALGKYWGRGARSHEVRPILEALKRRGGEQSINITHLLPSLARRLLYTYPGRSDSDMKTRPRDCHWTSMNFFKETPDDTFSHGAKLAGELQANYYPIGGNLRLGDVIIITKPGGQAVHSAVYIADDVLFHRCGPDSSAPWSLTRRKHIMAYYPSHQKLEVRYYRNNSL